MKQWMLLSLIVAMVVLAVMPAGAAVTEVSQGERTMSSLFHAPDHSSMDIGIPLTTEQMHKLIAGQGCLGIFGYWYGSNKCCTEMKVATVLLGGAAKLTDDYRVAIACVLAGLYVAIVC